MRQTKYIKTNKDLTLEEAEKLKTLLDDFFQYDFNLAIIGNEVIYWEE